MRIFNLAEELEKERKKNKELEERINSALNYIYDHYDLGTEKEVSFCILRDRVLERLKGSDNNE